MSGAAVMTLLALASPSASYAAAPPASALRVPADPAPPLPHPLPDPTPAPPPVPPGKKPPPAPPPPADHSAPAPKNPAEQPPASGLMPPACKAYGYSCEDDSFSLGGLLDIPGMVEDAITGFLGSLVEQVMKPVREMLADTLLATPDVTSQGDVKQLWLTMLGITGGLYVLFVTAGGITVMGYETVQARYALKQIAPRLLMGMVAAATSLTVMGKAIGLSNAVAHAIMATDMSDAAQGAIKRALPLPTNPSSELLLVILGLVAGVLVLATLIGFLVRVAVMALLAVCAPLALACHAHPLTDPIARMWWRGLAGCLAIQVTQSMTFILSLKLFFAPGATSLGLPTLDGLDTTLAGLALFWVLFKIPSWTLQVVLRGSPVQPPRAPTPVHMLKHLAMYQLLGPYVYGRRPPGRPGPPGGGLGRRGGGPRGPSGRPPGGGGPPGGPPSAGGPGRAAGSGPRGRGPAPRKGAATPPPRPAPASPGPSASATVGTRAPVTSAPAPAEVSNSAPRPAAVVRVRPAGGPGSPHSARTQHSPRARPPSTSGNRRAPDAAPRRPDRSGPPSSPPAPARTSPARESPAQAASPTLSPRPRQMSLPIPAERVRTRPPRPIQLRLPLESPRSNPR
jgi:hypothetical protein